jgi:hypothetical protein
MIRSKEKENAWVTTNMTTSHLTTSHLKINVITYEGLTTYVIKLTW